jgi:hypothetical protein
MFARPQTAGRAHNPTSINSDLGLTLVGFSMKSFSLVPSSEGPRREFKITWGLRAGYGPSGRIYDLEEAIRAAHRWMRERDARSEPFLSGMFTRGEVVYAGSEAEAAHDREPVAIFTGEVPPLYAADIGASEIGRILEQEEVHVAYRDRTWTLKAVGEVARP